METNRSIHEVLEGFFKTSTGEEIEILEKLLYEWYRNYAIDHHHIDRINEVVHTVFKVNDLLLQLNDETVALKESLGEVAENLKSDHYDYRYAG